MRLIDQDRAGLIEYTVKQISAVCPDGSDDINRSVIARHIDEALERLAHCIRFVAMWKPDEFNYLHSSQNCQYLYYLSNTIWRNERHSGVCTRLFLLNKALNAIDLFYEIELPPVFFIGHSVGIVFSKAVYGNYFAIYQNSTIGRYKSDVPVIGEGVLMYPNTAIIGKCRIGDYSIISQGVSVIGRDTPGSCLVFPGEGRELAFSPAKPTALDDIFRS